MAALATSFVPPLPSEAVDNNRGLKLKFAAMYVKTNDATKSAMAVCDPGMALQVADKWVMDPVVIDEMNRIIGDDPMSLLPTKERILMEMKARIDAFSKPEDYIKGMELYCKMRDFVPKPGTSTTEVKVAVQSVLVIPSQGTNDDWERRSAMSQSRLVLNAASS